MMRMAAFEIARVVHGTSFFEDMERALRGALGSGGSGRDGGSRRTPPRDDPTPRRPGAAPLIPLLFRAADPVVNRDGETGTVVSDVRVGDTEMTIRIEGDLETVKVGEWRKA